MLYTLLTGLSFFCLPLKRGIIQWFLKFLKNNNRFPAHGQGPNLQIRLCVPAGKPFGYADVYMQVDDSKMDNSPKLSLQMLLTL